MYDDCANHDEDNNDCCDNDEPKRDRRQFNLDLHSKLAKLYACTPAREWVLTSNLTSEQLWNTCLQPDWLLWVAARVGIDPRLTVGVGCQCVRKLLGDSQVPELLLLATEEWVAGKTSTDDLRYVWEKHNIAEGSMEVAISCLAQAALEEDEDNLSTLAALHSDALSYGSSNSLNRELCDLIRGQIKFEDVLQLLEKC